MPKHIGVIIHFVHTCLKLIQNVGLLAEDVLFGLVSVALQKMYQLHI